MVSYAWCLPSCIYADFLLGSHPYYAYIRKSIAQSSSISSWGLYKSLLMSLCESADASEALSEDYPSVWLGTFNPSLRLFEHRRAMQQFCIKAFILTNPHATVLLLDLSYAGLCLTGISCTISLISCTPATGYQCVMFTLLVCSGHSTILSNGVFEASQGLAVVPGWSETAFAKLSLRHKNHKAWLGLVYYTSLQIKLFLHYW